MKKDKLIELYYYLLKKEINVTELIENIKKLSDDEIDIVLKSKYPKYMILLLTNNNFKSLDEYSKNEIISIFKKFLKKKMFKYLLSIVDDNNIRNYGLTSSFIKIINNSYGEVQAKNATMISKNPHVLKSDLALELVSLVSNAITNQSSIYAANVASNVNVLFSGKALLLVDIISKCSKGYQIQFAYDVATDTNLLLNSNDVVELTRIVSSARGYDQAYHASIVARNKNISTITNIKDVVRIIAYMPKEKVKYLNFEKDSTDHISYLINPREIVEYYYNIYRNDDINVLENLYNELSLKLNQKEEKTDNISDNIWENLKQNPQETIDILKEIDDNIEIEESFSLKRKK